MTEIDSVWGTPLNETIYSVASKGDNKAEASYIINHGGFYYLFVNHGQCCDGVNSTYYITMGRSESQTGPYLDKTGKDLYNGGGTTVFSTSGSFIGPGCSGYYIENGKEWFTCHYYDGNNYGQAMLCIARIQWDENNWPVIKWNWIDNGVYSIANKNSNLVWDISGTGEDRDPVIQKQYARSASQQWDFYWLGNGTYEISASGNGLLAKITDCMGNAGAKISIGEALSYDCEKWVIDRTNDASFIFTSLYGGKVAEVPDFSMEENVQLEMNNYTGAANQKWILWDTARGVHVQGLSAMQNGIRVFPNPSQGGNFMIETDQNSGICEIMVYSLDGRNINHEELAVKQIINVKNTLTPGIYIVKVKINSYFLTFKLNVY
jgi:arabinan endo-1,5-alpha-L-arabinosidase